MEAIRNIWLKRIASYLNYTRSFQTPASAIITIPMFPYDSFDHRDASIKPLNILRLLESARVYSYSVGVCKESTERSMLDMYTLYQNHHEVILGVKGHIEQRFYRTEPPMYPLYVRIFLKCFGKSSKTISYELRQCGSDVLFFTLDVTDVLVSNEKGQAVSYPDWWVEKYTPFVENKKLVLPEIQLSRQSATTNITVQYSDLVVNRHTNWTTYLQFCTDSIHRNVHDKKYTRITQSTLDSGIRVFDIVYKGESKLGDELVISSSESESDDKTVNMTISNGNNICINSRFVFNSSTNIHSSL